MGGGYQAFTSEDVASTEDPVSEYLAPREDGRELIDEWIDAKENEKAAFVRSKSELMDVDTSDVDYLMGNLGIISSIC